MAGAARPQDKASVPLSVRESTIEILANWQPPDSAQDSLRHAVLAFVQAREDACRRACVPGHVTASAIVLDASGGRVLLTLHPRLGRWVQLGGHCEDEDDDLVAAALREATEEIRDRRSADGPRTRCRACSSADLFARRADASPGPAVRGPRSPARRSPSATSPTTCAGGPRTRYRPVPITRWPTWSPRPPVASRRDRRQRGKERPQSQVVSATRARRLG